MSENNPGNNPQTPTPNCTHNSPYWSMVWCVYYALIPTSLTPHLILDLASKVRKGANPVCLYSSIWKLSILSLLRSYSRQYNIMIFNRQRLDDSCLQPIYRIEKKAHDSIFFLFCQLNMPIALINYLISIYAHIACCLRPGETVTFSWSLPVKSSGRWWWIPSGICH
jgi:hypothetical protein